MSVSPLCVNCVSGDKLPGTPRGTVRKIGPYETYVSKPNATEETTSDKAIVLFTDVFGLDLVNIKLIADMLADRTGFVAYIPDLFNGKPISPEHMSIPSSAAEIKSQGLFTKVTSQLKMMTYAPWVIRNWPTGKYNDVEQYLQAVRKEEGVQRVGGVGYCYGGKIIVDFNTKGLLDATVGCHPSFCKPASFSQLKAPMMLNCAEEDDMFPVKALEQTRAMLANDSKAPVHDFKVFPGTAHSFCARPNLADSSVKKAFEEATVRTADWFKSHL